MRLLSIAPMIDWSNRHFRFFMRLLCPNALLYTEMIHVGAVLNNSLRVLRFNNLEHPLAIQLGGSSPHQLAHAARLASSWGYDEVNLNVGCPSPRVQSGRFGACLMAEPTLVADCIKSMQEATTVPVTVKTRIGIDKEDSEEFLNRFVETVKATGCKTFIVHARKAWLKGLSPKENRSIPPLDYDRVYRLKKNNPELSIIINGGINTLGEVNTHLTHVDGVMLGRLAMNDSYQCAVIDSELSGLSLITRETVLERYLIYCQEQERLGVSRGVLLKPIFSLANGLSGAKKWRQTLSHAQLDSGRDLSALADAFKALFLSFRHGD